MNYFVRLALTAVFCIAPIQQVFAAVPDSIEYQGQLTDNSGNPIDASVNVNFIIYDALTLGNTLWSDIQTLDVDEGLFNAELGRTAAPFPANMLDQPVWLELIVDGEKLSPRKPLRSAPYAIKADDADTLEGTTAAQLDQSAHVSDTANPHAVTAAQVGAATSADLTTHTTDTANPHSVTAAQVGAATAADITAHQSNASAHHSKTTSFADLVDQAADGQIPAAITRDSELSAHSSNVTNPHAVTAAQVGAATTGDFTTHTGNASAHHTRYADAEAVIAIKAADGAGSTLDADRVDGLEASEIIDAAADEVRTPIYLDSGFSGPFGIFQPGSYYLTSNFQDTVLGAGLYVQASNVTIDLMGFTITGGGTNADSGIYLLNSDNVTIKNGTIQDFDFHGIYLHEADNVTISNVTVKNNAGNAISLYTDGPSAGEQVVISNSHFLNNGGGVAITTGIIKDSTFTSNSGNTAISCDTCLIARNKVNHTSGTGTAIAVDSESVVENNLIYGRVTGTAGNSIVSNTINAVSGYGLELTSTNIVKNNTITATASTCVNITDDNVVTGNTVTSCGLHGINAGTGNKIEDNIVFNNSGTGVNAGFASIIRNNQVRANVDDGVYTKSGSLVDGNNIYFNGGWGIYGLSGPIKIENNNLYFNNSAATSNEGGIRVNADSSVKNNTLDQNTNYGIYVNSSSNVIEENHVSDTIGTGIGIHFVDSSTNFYMNNRMSGNSTSGVGGHIPTGSLDGGGNIDF